MSERRTAWLPGLALSLLLNAGLLFGLSLYRRTSLETIRGPEEPGVRVELRRLEPTTRPMEVHPPAPAPSRRVRTTARSPPAAAPVPQRPAAASAAPAPSAAQPSAPAAAPSGDDRGEAAARTAAALRGLGACADFGHDGHGEGRCGQAWGYHGGGVDPLSAEARAALTPVDRQADQQALQAHLKGALGDHNTGMNSSHMGYGCTRQAGKWRCGIY